MSIWDEYDYDPSDERTAECKFCGKAGLYWEELEPGRWRLVDENGLLHRCSQKRLDRRAANDFEDLDK